MISDNFDGEPPVVTSVNPNTANNNEDTVITITGTDFISECGRGVFLGSVSLSTWSIDSDNQITARIPACTFAAGTYHVRIWANDGYSAETVNDQVTLSPSLAITSVVPNTIDNDIDNVVTISGSDFTCATGVELINANRTINLTTWSINNDNQITATIPTGIIAATYHTVVVTGFGESPQTANDQVTVNE
jgi:hypothetical protein